MLAFPVVGLKLLSVSRAQRGTNQDCRERRQGHVGTCVGESEPVPVEEASALCPGAAHAGSETEGGDPVWLRRAMAISALPSE